MVAAFAWGRPGVFIPKSSIFISIFSGKDVIDHILSIKVRFDLLFGIEPLYFALIRMWHFSIGVHPSGSHISGISFPFVKELFQNFLPINIILLIFFSLLDISFPIILSFFILLLRVLDLKILLLSFHLLRHVIAVEGSIPFVLVFYRFEL